MAFGQQSGPPASHTQMRELTELLEAAGHSDFRDARGPMGFTQRQAGGKFTRDEADEFIAQLHEEAEAAEQADASPSAAADRSPDNDPAPTPPRSTSARPGAKRSEAKRPEPGEQTFRGFTDAELAAELQRRGWVVMEP